MKGILKSNTNNDWFVWYTNIENSSVYEKVLPLIRDFSNWVYYNPTDGLEVEFEIVEVGERGDEQNFPRSYKTVQYAKLISPEQEESSNWDEIFEAWLHTKSHIDLSLEEVNCLKNWFKEHYNPPVKR